MRPPFPPVPPLLNMRPELGIIVDPPQQLQDGSIRTVGFDAARHSASALSFEMLRSTKTELRSNGPRMDRVKTCKNKRQSTD